MESMETMKVVRGLRRMVSPKKDNNDDDDKLLGKLGLLILWSKWEGRKCCGGKRKNNLRLENGIGKEKVFSFSLLRIMLFYEVKSFECLL